MAIILGADNWPHFSQLGRPLNGGLPFCNSASLAKNFFLSSSGLSLAGHDVLDLFNSPLTASQQLNEIQLFLSRWTANSRTKGPLLNDVFLYYVGHGDFYGSSNDLLLLIRDSVPHNDLSGIQSRALARILKQSANESRHVVILDCCWSGAVIRHWMSSSAADAAVKSVERDFPTKGTVLVCSSSEDMPSMAPSEATFSLFTDAFFKSLLTGTENISGDLSARQVKELAFDIMARDWPDLAVRPVVYGMERGGGDLSETPYFRNYGGSFVGDDIYQIKRLRDKNAIGDDNNRSTERRPETKSKKYGIRLRLLSAGTLGLLISISLHGDMHSPRFGPFTCSWCLDMIYVEGGEFIMGTPEDELQPQHDFFSEPFLVRVSPFYIARNTITFVEWDQCVQDGGCKRISAPDDGGFGRDQRPVININYFDVQEFILWLNKYASSGETYRLPTSAEWEYAARAGTTTPFTFGHRINRSQANYDGERPYGDGEVGPRSYETVPINELDASNAWGIRHMHGNVWEWTEDCWHDSYIGHPDDGSAWMEEDGGDCERRVLRGGSFGNAAINLRSAERSAASVHSRQSNLGFRVVRQIDAE